MPHRTAIGVEFDLFDRQRMWSRDGGQDQHAIEQTVVDRLSIETARETCSGKWFNIKCDTIRRIKINFLGKRRLVDYKATTAQESVRPPGMTSSAA